MKIKRNIKFNALIIIFLFFSFSVFASENFLDMLVYESKKPVFTEEELSFIKAQASLKIVCDPAMFPVEYYDTRTKTFNGYGFRLLELIQRYSGLRFEYIYTKSWLESLQLVKQGRAQVITGFFDNKIINAEANINTTMPYIEIPFMLFTKKNNTVYSNQPTVAIQKNYYSLQNFVKINFPSLQVKTYKTTTDVVNAVLENKADYLFISGYFANTFLGVLSNSDLQVVDLPEKSYALCLGISRTLDPVVISILNKSIAAITEQQRSQLLLSSIDYSLQNLGYSPVVQHYQSLFALIGVTLLLFILVIFLIIRYRYQKKIEDLAFLDGKFKLPNRNAFVAVLEKMCYLKLKTPIAIITVNIFNFIQVNRVLGYANGDMLLGEVGKYLNNLDKKITVYRYGGDIFVLLLEDNDFVLANEICAKILQQFENNWITPTFQYKLTASVGLISKICEFEQVSNVIDAIDSTMVEMKYAKADSFFCFNTNILQKINRKYEVFDALLRAIKHNTFSIYIQPIYRISSQSFVSGEVLLRLVDEKLGSISPAEFIPVAEEYGLMNEIGLFVLTSACRKIQELKKNCPSFEHLSVNVSVLQFMQKHFVADVTAFIEEFNIPEGALVLEVTESVLINSFDLVHSTMHILQEKGVKFSIDDFGTGFSGMNYIFNLPINEIKLDKSFIDQIGQNTRTQLLLKNLITMAHDLAVPVVAEGVEEKYQKEFLEINDCDYLQGFYYFKPIHQDRIQTCPQGIYIVDAAI